MKWINSKSTATCAKQPLAQLLKDELDEIKAASVTEHLNRCEHCQQKLTMLSAEPKWWREAGQWLENATIDEDFGETSAEEEYGEQQGALPEEALIQCGLILPSTNTEMIGSIGRYDVRRVVGTGGTGIVLQAVDTELDRVVAVKVLSPAFASNGPARRRFAREGQAAAAVVHENVVAIHHVESNGPVPFLVMQFVDGSSLHEQIIRTGPMDPISTLRVIAQLASALDTAHAQGLVHRDVKPANILVGSAGQRVWITDFGLARAVDDASLTRTGFIAGTPHYMSPEQARGETVGAGSDLFGLGSVMYFVLTGRPPFRAERSLAILNRICNEKHRPVREVNPEVPPAVAAIVDRLLEKVPSQRYQTANEVRDECLRLLSHPDAINEVLAQPTLQHKPSRMKAVALVGLLVFCSWLVGGWIWHSLDSYAAHAQPMLGKSSLVTANSWQESMPTMARSPTTVVSQPILSESELWQRDCDAFGQELAALQQDWKLQIGVAALEVASAQDHDFFEQNLTQMKEMLDQLSFPVGEPIQVVPYVSY